MANDGSALGSVARIKQQIVLRGGVLTSLAILPTFEAYIGAAASRIVDGEVPQDDTRWHAVFCYGYADDPRNNGEGYWLCKNRWAWGVRGCLQSREAGRTVVVGVRKCGVHVCMLGRGCNRNATTRTLRSMHAYTITKRQHHVQTQLYQS
jgi:hypothetical protein